MGIQIGFSWSFVTNWLPVALLTGNLRCLTTKQKLYHFFLITSSLPHSPAQLEYQDFYSSTEVLRVNPMFLFNYGNTLHTHTAFCLAWQISLLHSPSEKKKMCLKQNCEINLFSNMTINPGVKTHISLCGQSDCSALWCTSAGEQSEHTHRDTHWE